MTEKPEYRTVARPGSEQSRASEAPKKQSTVSWRTISLISAPFVLGMINLVDAYVDKQKAMFEGDQLHRTAVESGKAQAKSITSQANKSADTIYNQRTAGARQEAESILMGAIAKARETREQGTAESKVVLLRADQTREAVRQYLAERLKR